MTTPASSSSAPALLNLGCGDRFHPDWVNLDLVSCHPAVRACDLRRDLLQDLKAGGVDPVVIRDEDAHVCSAVLIPD